MNWILSITIIALAILLALVTCQTEPSTTKKSSDTTKSAAAFENYKKKYKKTYANKNVSSKALETYAANMKRNEEHNKNESRSYDRGENDMTDMTHVQATRTRCGVNGSQIIEQEKAKQKAEKAKSDNVTIKSVRGAVRIDPSKLGYNVASGRAPNVRKSVASSMDFRPKLPAIKDQGSCGSCWTVRSISYYVFYLLILKGASFFIFLTFHSSLLRQ